MSNYLMGIIEFEQPIPTESDRRGGVAFAVVREALREELGAVVGHANMLPELLSEVGESAPSESHILFLLTDHPGIPYADRLLTEYDCFVDDEGVTRQEPPLRDRMNKIQAIVANLLECDGVAGIDVITFQVIPEENVPLTDIPASKIADTLVNAFEREEQIPDTHLRIRRDK